MTEDDKQDARIADLFPQCLPASSTLAAFALFELNQSFYFPAEPALKGVSDPLKNAKNPVPLVTSVSRSDLERFAGLSPVYTQKYEPSHILPWLIPTEHVKPSSLKLIEDELDHSGALRARKKDLASMISPNDLRFADTPSGEFVVCTIFR
jgi:hypothetical protein